MDAHTSLLTLCEFTFVTVPFGIATATTIRVGNMLGANRPGAAQRAGELPLLPAIDPADDANSLLKLFTCVKAGLQPAMVAIQVCCMIRTK